MKDRIVLLMALLGDAAFLFLVKQIYDMNGHMARITEQMAEMGSNMEAMSTDVKGMRESVDRMAMIVARGSQTIEQFNPMEMMEGFVPGGPPR